jgi:hypothetical protein
MHAQVRLLVAGQAQRVHVHRPGLRLLGNGRHHAAAVDLARLRTADVDAGDFQHDRQLQAKAA